MAEFEFTDEFREREPLTVDDILTWEVGLPPRFVEWAEAGGTDFSPVEPEPITAFEDIPEGAPVSIDLTLGLASRSRDDDGQPLI